MELKMLPIECIQLDIENPRIAQALSRHGEALDAETIAQYLSLDDTDSMQEDKGTTTYRSLKKSIKANKGIIHPIIVNRIAEESYIVIEGNTRWSIYKEFKEAGNVEGNWDSIPSLVSDKMSRAQISSIRLQAHLVGPREWRPYNKAKYLYDLSVNQHLTNAQIVEFCGGNSREVDRYIEAYQLMEREYRTQLTDEAQFKATKFSAFVEYVNPVKRQAVLSAGFKDEDFARWVIQDKFPRLMLIRRLPEILENDESRRKFLEEDAEEACRLLDANRQNQGINFDDVSLMEISQVLSHKIQTMQFSELQRLKSDLNGRDYVTIMNAKDELIDLCNEIEGIQ